MFRSMENCELYITSLAHNGQSWLDNPDYLLESIFNNLTDIKDFYFVNLTLNMAQVYNVSLKQTNYDSMILYLKGIKYKHEEFIDLKNIKELETEIKKQLKYIEGLYFGEMEFRNSESYTDLKLGLIELPRRT